MTTQTATITGNLKKTSAVFTSDQNVFFSGNLKSLTASSSAAQSSHVTLSANINKLTASIPLYQNIYSSVSGNLKKLTASMPGEQIEQINLSTPHWTELTGNIIVSQRQTSTLNGQIRKITSSMPGGQGIQWTSTGSLSPITSNMTVRQALNTASFAAGLRKISAVFSTQPPVTISGNLKPLTSHINIYQTDFHMVVGASLRPLSSNMNLIFSNTPLFSFNANIRKISGSIATSSSAGAYIQLKSLTSHIVGSNYSPFFAVNGNIRSLTGHIYTVKAFSISASLKKMTGATTAVKGMRTNLAGNLNRLTASVMLGRSNNVQILANLNPIIGNISANQNTYIQGNLKSITGNIGAKDIQVANFNGQLNKIRGYINQTKNITVSGNLNKISGTFTYKLNANLSAKLKKLSGLINATTVSTITVSAPIQLNKLNSSVAVDNVIVIHFNGMLKSLTVSNSGNIKKLTSNINLNNINSGQIIAGLNPITSYIDSYINISRFSSAASLKKITGTASGFSNPGFPATIMGQMYGLTSSMSLTRTITFSQNIQLKILSGRITAEQALAPVLIRPTGFYTKTINVQNPYNNLTGYGSKNFSEPVFISAVVNGVNILSNLIETVDNYDDPSVDEILHGITQRSFLGNIQTGSIISPGSIAISVESNITSSSIVSWQVLPNTQALPPGLTLTNPSNGVAYISGTVTNIPYNVSSYQFLLRVKNSLNIQVDRYFYFNVISPQQVLAWNNPIVSSNVIRVGNRINIPFSVTNYLQRNLTFTITPPLFSGLQIQNGAIVGTTNTILPYGNYGYVVTVSDGVLPPVSAALTLQLAAGGSVVTLTSNSITWTSSASYLGSTYSLLPSYFGVSAKASDGSAITYSISPVSNALPGSMTLNTSTGDFQGLVPLQTSNQTYSVTIRATDGILTSDKQFTFSVLTQYDSTTVMSAELYMEEPARLITELDIWNASTIKDSIVFRPQTDMNYGRVLRPRINLGMRSTTSTNLTTLINNMNTKMNEYNYYTVSVFDPVSNTTVQQRRIGLFLTLGTVGYTPVYNPDGSYIYDVIYINVIDPQTNASGFVNGVETVVDQTTSSGVVQVYPKSLNNVREAWLSFVDPLDVTDAGLPLSQRGSHASGWQQVIEILYVEAGQGVGVVDSMNSTGFAASILGAEFTTGTVTIDIVNQ